MAAKLYDIENPTGQIRSMSDGINTTPDGKKRQQKMITLNPGEKKTGIEFGDEVVEHARKIVADGQKADPSFKDLIITDHHGDEPGSGQPPKDEQRDHPRKK